MNIPNIVLAIHIKAAEWEFWGMEIKMTP